MTSISCPSCGRRLLVAPGHAGGDAGCPSCGATVRVPDAPPAPAPEKAPPAPPPRAEHVSTRPRPDASPAHRGEVPRPRASGAGDDAQLPLALAAASVVVPILGPIALWLVQRASLPFRLRGDLEPASLRHARLLAITGTVLLVLLFVCFGPTLLVVG